MNKFELIEVAAQEAEISKAAAGKALDGIINAVVKAVAKGDTVTLVGFGTFKSSKRAARPVAIRKPARNSRLLPQPCRASPRALVSRRQSPARRRQRRSDVVFADVAQSASGHVCEMRFRESARTAKPQNAARPVPGHCRYQLGKTWRRQAPTRAILLPALEGLSALKPIPTTTRHPGNLISRSARRRIAP